MFQLLTALAVIASCIMSFYTSPTYTSLLPIFVVDIFFVAAFIGTRIKFSNIHVEGLSQPATQFFNKYAHFYCHPHLCSAISLSIANLQVGGFVVAIIHSYYGNWHSWIPTVANFVAMQYLGMAYCPKFAVESKPSAMRLHEEILGRLLEQRDAGMAA